MHVMGGGDGCVGRVGGSRRAQGRPLSTPSKPSTPEPTTSPHHHLRLAMRGRPPSPAVHIPFPPHLQLVEVGNAGQAEEQDHGLAVWAACGGWGLGVGSWELGLATRGRPRNRTMGSLCGQPAGVGGWGSSGGVWRGLMSGVFV